MAKNVSYRALTGISYPPSKRIEKGGIVDDLDGKDVPWLLEAGYIELASEPDTGKVPNPIIESQVETAEDVTSPVEAVVEAPAVEVVVEPTTETPVLAEVVPEPTTDVVPPVDAPVEISTADAPVAEVK